MKILFHLFFVVSFILLAGCAPSAEAIQKAIEQTQAAIPTSTSTTISISTPVPIPTSVPMSNGDFVKSWDTFDSTYDYTCPSILTITKRGSEYTMKKKWCDGTVDTYDLNVISDTPGNIKLTDSPGNSYGDYMLISSDGYLGFYDNLGLIYEVPPLP